LNTSLLLASNSPRRKQLIALGGWPFRVQAADIDESPLPGEAPGPYVLRLAESKARAVAALVESESLILAANGLILAADTTVADGTELLGKPADAGQAVKMLTQLRGRVHQVYTGFALLRPADGMLVTDLCATDVPMRNYTDEEIRAYVASGDPLDKAGAYAIQHRAFNPVASLEGCYANVVGLPLCHLTRALRRLRIPPLADVPAGCQQTLGYECPVFEQILQG
jgi:septum formation protein